MQRRCACFYARRALAGRLTCFDTSDAHGAPGQVAPCRVRFITVQSGSPGYGPESMMTPMNELRLKLAVILVVFFASIAIPGVLATLSLSTVKLENNRATVASQTLNAYLRLQVLAYALSQEYAPDRQTVHRNTPAQLSSLENATRQIDALIAGEVLTIRGGAVPGADIARFVAEEREQAQLLQKIDHSIRAMIAGQNDMAWEGLIIRAVATEEREVRESQSRAIAMFDTVRNALLVLVVAITFACIVVAVWIHRQFIAPLTLLLGGTRSIAQGNYGYRMPVFGSSEFRAIMSSFNDMANRVSDANRALLDSNSDLEQAVGKRTVELETANAKLRRANEMRRNFLADASHELRTPLAILRGEAEVTLRQPALTSDDLRTGLRRVVKMSAEMGDLIDDLLYVARSEELVLPTTLGPIDLCHVAQDAVTEVKPLIEADGGRIRLTSELERLTIIGDDGRLRQLLRIIIDNAIRYSSDPARIDVSVSNGRCNAWVTITDDGEGIAKDDLERVFQRFNRGKTRTGDGQGLGLPIAQSIAEAHGGMIAIDSAEGRGTTVTIRLPLSTPLPPEASTPP